MKISNLIRKELQSLGTPENAANLLRFFKTGKGQYGEGDKFYGVKVPQQRAIAKKCWKEATKDDIVALLDSDYHEERLIALFILTEKYREGCKVNDAKQWVDLYLKKLDRLNNWDLVDSSASYILGHWLQDRDRSILYKLARSKSLWDNRVAMLAAGYFIRDGEIEDVVKLTRIFLSHKHDLMHKATGWMLRVAWMKKPKEIEALLTELGPKMPRTMLRYAIEKMGEEERKSFLAGKAERR